MDVHFLLLLVCLCTLFFPSPVLALQRDASTLDTAAVESVRQRRSHGSHSQEKSRQGGLITVHHSERLRTQSSTSDMYVLARRLLSHGERQVLQDDKEQPKNKVHKHDTTSIKLEKGSSANTKPLGDTGHENSTNITSGDEETDKTSVPPPPSAKPKDVQEPKVNITSPNVEKADDQVKNNSTHPDKKPNAPAIHCGESQCEDPKKLVSACLRIPGDGVHKISLFITNEGDSEVRVKVVAPEYLTADPVEVSVLKGKSETIQFLMDSKFEPSTSDLEAVKNQNITVITDYDECKIAVPLEYLRNSGKQKTPFSSYLPSVTPTVVAYLVALVLVVSLVGGLVVLQVLWEETKRGCEVSTT